MDHDHTPGLCFFCGEEPLVEAYSNTDGQVIPDLLGCCLEAREAGPELAYGMTLEAIFGAYFPGLRRVENDLDHVEPVLRFGLEVRELNQKGARALTRAFISEHHRHCPNAPAAEKARFGVFDGRVLVGVALLGIPTARRYFQAYPDRLEITRVCVNPRIDRRLSRNACSSLYGAACRWAKNRGFSAVITYTLECEETAASVRAANFTPEAIGIAGGKRQRKGRARGESGPSQTKIRWFRTLAA
jgi:hypothetical protein